MALTVGDRTVRPLTADEVIRMVELGILGEDEPVELLDGVLTRVSPKSAQHQVVIARLFTWLATQPTRAAFEVRTEAALRVPDATALPEPDLVVLPAGSSVTEHPTSALLVVEVAVSSHAIDLGRKQQLYAAARVPESWVVDVPGRRLVRFTGPVASGYAECTALAPPASVRPLGLEVAALDVADLLAGLSWRPPGGPRGRQATG